MDFLTAEAGLCPQQLLVLALPEVYPDCHLIQLLPSDHLPVAQLDVVCLDGTAQTSQADRVPGGQVAIIEVLRPGTMPGALYNPVSSLEVSSDFSSYSSVTVLRPVHSGHALIPGTRV